MSSGWRPPAHIQVDGTPYPVRLNADGYLDVLVHDTWQSQSLFQVYDDDSAQLVTSFVVSWARRRLHRQSLSLWSWPTLWVN